jgi:hypothetical protein
MNGHAYVFALLAANGMLELDGASRQRERERGPVQPAETRPGHASPGTRERRARTNHGVRLSLGHADAPSLTSE